MEMPWLVLSLNSFVVYFQVVNQKLKQFWLGYWEIWTSHF